MGPASQWSTGPSQGQPRALTRGGARPWHTRTARAAAPADDGVMRRGEAGPERGKGRAHGEKEVAARLTSGGGPAARRAEAAAGGGARRRRCRKGEKAG